MQAIRRHRRWHSLLAALAIFALSLAPSISRAMAASAGFDPLAELCSTAGAVPGETGGAASHLDHCPLCSIGVALPAAEFGTAGAVVPSIVVAAQPAPVPVGLLPWAHAPPRGPPAFLRTAA